MKITKKRKLVFAVTQTLVMILGVVITSGNAHVTHFSTRYYHCCCIINLSNTCNLDENIEKATQIKIGNLQPVIMISCDGSHML